MFRRKEEPKRIKDIGKYNSIFNWLYANNYILPLWDTSKKAEICDMGYYFHSSLKILSYPIQEQIFSENDTDYVAHYIWSMFGMKWKAYWDALNIEYNKIHNNDIEYTGSLERRISALEKMLNSINEKELKQGTENLISKMKDSLHASSKGNDKQLSNSSSEEELTSNSSRDSKRESSSLNTHNSLNDENIYGFNSSDGSDANDTILTEATKDTSSEVNKDNDSKHDTSNTRNTVNTISETEVSSDNINESTNNESKTNDSSNLTNRFEESDKKDSSTQFDSTSRTEVGRRDTTPQSMIEEELELRKKILLDIVYGDIDSLITIQVY